jgi:hypothetical protein
MESIGTPALTEKPISARTSAFRLRKFSFASALVLLTSLIGGCSSVGVATTSTQFAVPGVANLVGIEADARLLSSTGENRILEVTVTTQVRYLERTCPDSQACPEEHVFQVRSSALVDYRQGAVAEAGVLTVENEVDATSTLAQVLTIEQVQPGGHCVAAFSQLLEVVNGEVVGREGLIGTYQYLASKDSQASLDLNCSTQGLTTANGTFSSSKGSGCGGLPNGITTDPLTGSDLGAEELMVLVPTCQQDLVAVIVSNGEVLPNDTRLVAGHDEAGFMSYVMPRLDGHWRVVTLPDEQFRGTVPDESPYWDVVVSPPREF